MMEALNACGSQRRRSESNRRMEVLQFSRGICRPSHTFRSCHANTSYLIRHLYKFAAFCVPCRLNLPKTFPRRPSPGEYIGIV
jgi:hypothetical protein